jgi:hypothetical protein
MVVFMFRPSPQCPKPTLAAAMRCYPCCEYNIYMHRDQIKNGNVDMTWIFTLAMFMNVNTILWTLSYEGIRRKYKREDVERHLNVALECIRIASERWPGVNSALELYKTLIAACMRIYDKQGDVEISVASPTDTTGYDSRSNTTSPVATMSQPFAPPALQASDTSGTATSENSNMFTPAPFSQIGPLGFVSPGTSPQSIISNQQPRTSAGSTTTTFSKPYHTSSDAPSRSLGDFSNPATHPGFTPNLFGTSANGSSFDGLPTSPQFPLPANFTNLDLWNPDFDLTTAAPAATIPALERYDSSVPPPFSTNSIAGPSASDVLELNGGTQSFAALSPSNIPWTDYLYPPSAEMTNGEDFGLTQEQQVELMSDLRGPGMGTIQGILDATNRVFYPPGRQPM